MQGDEIGYILIIVDGEVVAEVPAIASCVVEKQEYKDILGKIFDNFRFIN